MAPNADPQRHNAGYLQPLEKPALLWLAARMPAGVTPDQLTAVGFIGACVTAAAYVLSRWNPAFLWLATLGLMVNWFGDSLDGTVARHRNIERPRYGFLLDQSLDALAQLVFAVGIGLSGFVRLDVALLTLAAYFLMSILSLVRAVVSGVFPLAYAGIGLTELRVVFAGVNALVFFVPPKPLPIAGLWLGYVDLLSIVWAGSMVVVFCASLATLLREVPREE